MDSIRRAALAGAAAFRDAASVTIVGGKKDCSVRGSGAGAGGGAANADQPFGARRKWLVMLGLDMVGWVLL